MPNLFGSPAHLHLLFAVGGVALVFCLVWVAEYSPLSGYCQSFGGVVGPFASLPGIFFALYFTYLTTGISHDRYAARTAVAAEASAVKTLADLSRLAGAGGTEFRGQLAEYVRLGADTGWRSGDQHRRSNDLLSSLYWSGLHGRFPGPDGEARRLVLAKLNEIAAANRDRFTLTDRRPQQRKWAAAFVLALITQLAILATHLGKPRASLLAGLLWAIAWSLSLSTMANLLDPFEGGAAADVGLIAASLGGP